MEFYRYRFDNSIPSRDIEDTFMLALLAVESIYGYSRVRMESRFSLDRQNRTCTIHTSTKTGSDLASIFTGFATIEYGESAVKIDRETEEVAA